MCYEHVSNSSMLLKPCSSVTTGSASRVNVVCHSECMPLRGHDLTIQSSRSVDQYESDSDHFWGGGGGGGFF